MEREPSGFPFLEINNILTRLKCLQLVKKVVLPLFSQAGAASVRMPLIPLNRPKPALRIRAGLSWFKKEG